jgi:adenylate kinase family enzyme
MDLLKQELNKRAPDTKGFLIDGFPREMSQAKEFEESVCHKVNAN